MSAPKPESIAKKKKLEKMSWTTKPCAICAKPVQVLESHEGDTWCMEHAGTWKKGVK